ncbi:hypothetical protein D3C73_670200 [compost metagenome]
MCLDAYNARELVHLQVRLELPALHNPIQTSDIHLLQPPHKDLYPEKASAHYPLPSAFPLEYINDRFPYISLSRSHRLIRQFELIQP